MPGIPILQLRGNSLVQYSEQVYQSSFMNGRKARSRMLHAKKTAYTAFSPGSRKRLTRTITIMAGACQARWVKNHKNEWQYFRMSFITCELVKKIDTDQAKKMWSDFLQWLRRDQQIRAYIWKMEFTDKGIPHFHLLCSDYVNHREINLQWNRIMKEAGLLDDYAEKNHTFLANTTDVTAVGKVDDLAAYMVKELAKDIQAKKLKIKKDLQTNFPELSADEMNDQIEAKVNEQLKLDGKAWDCSMNLRGVPYFSVAMGNDLQRKITELILRNQATVKADDFFAIINLHGVSPPTLLSENERKRYDQHHAQVFIDPDGTLEEIVAEAVSPKADPEKTYRWEQMQMLLN